MSLYDCAKFMPSLCQLSQVFGCLELWENRIKIPIRAAHKGIKALIATLI